MNEPNNLIRYPLDSWTFAGTIAVAGLGEFAGMQKDLGRFTFKKYELDDVNKDDGTNKSTRRESQVLL